MKIVCPKCGSDHVTVTYPEKRVPLDEIATRSGQTVRKKGVAVGECHEPGCGYRIEWEEWEQ